MPLPVKDHRKDNGKDEGKDHGYSRHVIGVILGIPLLFLLIICPFLEFINIQYSQYIPGKAKLGKFIVEGFAGMLDYLPRKEDMKWYNKWFASEESSENEFIANQTDVVEWVQSTRRETFAR
ncbi:10377_t:CDS:2 [Racocetra persica]|uniref:10377_t:CDS:1 n=1 Tax=Racocetra persica TaxID=160502 RepID=A0ACA9N2A7_9GLOM|nr:10377_t:CDS:2 [Racocetra persica]